MDDLGGRTAIVTGGSSGIGAASVRRLAAAGARVAVGYHRDRMAAEALVAALPGTGHLAMQLRIDDAQSLAAAVAAVSRRFDKLDILVNSAGSTESIPAADLDTRSDEIFDQITRVNLRGPFATIRAFRPLLDVSADAVIVNIGSIAARTGVGSNLAYCAAKAGLDALTVGLAKALGPRIRVLTVAPAGVDTDFVKGRASDALETVAARMPLQKVTTPDDVARAVMACITLLTSSTGISLPVDEGRHL
jgi:3-oxoacyl-[acyl-carrier protein] reductase